MSWKENLMISFGNLMCVAVAIFVIVVLPFEIINAESHTVLEKNGNFKFIGLAFILFGIVGYLACFWSFIFDAKGAPLFDGMQKHLTVKGPYKYVRNPMYISLYLTLLGEAIYFQSVHLLFYLLGWMVFFQLRVVFSEEPYLSDAFGESCESYRKSVRRWIPRLKASNIETN